MNTNLTKWLTLAGALAPMVAGLIPAAAPIAPYIGPAVQLAEQIPGADGPAKLSAATKIIQIGLQAAQVEGAPIDANAVGAATATVINAVVAIVNKAHANTPAAAAA